MTSAPNVLLLGGGSVGAIAAWNLEANKQAAVTVVCRSNFPVLSRNGYRIESCDHGTIQGYKPTGVLDKVPDDEIGYGSRIWDYVVCATKNVADVPPGVHELIRPAVTPGRTVVVLVQNGLNIEKHLFATFSQNVILSGVSLIGAKEPEPGRIVQDFPDKIFVRPFRNPNLDPEVEKAAAERFVEIYGAGGKTRCTYRADVSWTRWRKLVYNACLNPICALTGLATGRIRLADGAIAGLVRPAMAEIVAAAKASGYDLPETVVHDMIEMDPLDMYLPPSMLSNVRKGNMIEYENILGEALREGEKLGVAMPTLRVLYHLCQGVQWKNKELKGLVVVPPKGSFWAEGVTPLRGFFVSVG